MVIKPITESGINLQINHHLLNHLRTLHTHSKLHRLAREKTEGKLPNPSGNKEILDSPPFLILLINTRNKIKP